MLHIPGHQIWLIFLILILLPNYNRDSWGGRRAVAGEHKMGAGDMAFAYLEIQGTAIDIKEALAQPFVLLARWIKMEIILLSCSNKVGWQFVCL